MPSADNSEGEKGGSESTLRILGLGSPIGTSIGPYEVVRRLGIGGMSEVLLAMSNGPHGFRRPVVIKRLLPKCANDPAFARVLAREAMAYARLSHPAVVRLYDFFEADGTVAIVLEYVDGVSLSRLRAILRSERTQRLGTGRNATDLDDWSALYIGYRVFEALAAAHAAKNPQTGEFAPVIHRDVSPGNVLLPWDGYVKLADFGIAKVSGITSDTRIGLIKGTYGYMAPEQVLGEPVTVRTDVYAGCLLVRELLTRRITFPRGRLPELEFLRLMAEPNIPAIETLRPGLPRSLCRALTLGLQPDPDGRTITSAEMADVLRSILNMEEAHRALVDVLTFARRVIYGAEYAAGTRDSERFRTTPPHGGPIAQMDGAEGAIPPPRPLYDSLGAIAVSSGPSGPPPRPEFSGKNWGPHLQVDTPSAIPVTPRAKRSAWIGSAAALGVMALLATTVLVGRVVLGAAAEWAKRSHAPSSTHAPATRPPPTVVATTRPSVVATTTARSARPPPQAALTPSIQPSARAERNTPPHAAEPEPSAKTHAKPKSRDGELETVGTRVPHRVFVDNWVVGETASDPKTFKVPCGAHIIKIGGHGKAQSITVPCGGLARVDELR